MLEQDDSISETASCVHLILDYCCSNHQTENIVTKQDDHNLCDSENEVKITTKRRKFNVNPEEPIVGNNTCSMLRDENWFSMQQLLMKVQYKSLFMPKAFSLDFTHVRTLGVKLEKGTGNDHFSCPIDVKISYKYNCLLVSDPENHRIQVFDLDTKKYRQTLLPHSQPWYMVIESDYDEDGEEAIIMTTSSWHLHKYDLKDLLQSKSMRSTILWKSIKTKRSQAMVIKYNEESEDGNLIFTCDGDNSALKIFRSWDGVLLKSISTLTTVKTVSIRLATPCGIDMIPDGLDYQFVISDMALSSLVYVREIGNDLICYRRQSDLVAKGEVDFLSTPTGLCVDRNNGNIIICDYHTGSMKVLNKKGILVKTFGNTLKRGTTEFYRHTGVCINELNGELIVCDSFNERIQIYK